MNYFLLFVVILLVISETPLSSSNPDLYGPCSNQFKCGKVVAGFPFWGGDQRPRECGHPGLQLQCQNNDAAILEIIGVRYRVLEINQRDKKLKIAREDYAAGICPQNIQNTNLDATLFISAPDYVNITLLYGCPSMFSCPNKINPKFPTHESLHFKCHPKSPYGDDSTMGFILPGDTGPMGCFASATVLVRDDFYFSIEKIKQALKDGFEVEWKVDDEGYCQKCNASKGKCGINPLNETETVCYCQEPSSSSKECLPLPHDGKIMTALNIGLFMAGGIITGILLGGWWLLWYQRRKRIAAQSPSKGLPATPLSSKGLGLLRHVPPSGSPDSVETEKWGQIRTM